MCKAGYDHKALKINDAAWRALPFVGVQQFDDTTLEMRNCACGSTVCRAVARLDAAELLIREAA